MSTGTPHSGNSASVVITQTTLNSRCCSSPSSPGARFEQRTRRSAYAGQRLAVGLGQQSPSESGVEDDRAGTLGDAGADDRGIHAEGMRAQDVDQGVGELRRDADDRLPLVGDVQRIDAEDLAGGARCLSSDA